MWRRHLLRNLRTAFFIAVAILIVFASGGLWWANRTGLPENWRATIENELGKQGANLTIDSLSYVPFRGLIADGVRIFSDKERHKEVSRLERVVLDFNKTDLLNGKFRLTKVELSDARLSMPLDPENPDATQLEITGLNGTVLMPGGRLLEVREVRGQIAGIDVVLGARMLGYRQEQTESKDDPDEGKRREIAARIIRELSQWNFDADSPPVLRLFAEGDLSDKSTLDIRMGLRTGIMEKNGHTLSEVSARATLLGNLLTITSLKANDSRGELEGHVDYDIQTGEGRFNINSGLEIPTLLREWFDLPPIPEIVFGGKQKIEAAGEFKTVPDRKPDIHVTGTVRCDSVLLKGVTFESVESDFSWKDGDLYLRDVVLTRPDGTATGKALIQGPLVQLALHSTFPADVYLPLFHDQPLEQVLKDFGKLDGARADVRLEGGFDRRDRHSWAYTGRGSLEHMTFRGVPVAAANCSFALSHHELDFHDGTVVFNYDQYPLRNTYGGPARGTAKVGRIRYDPTPRHVEIHNVEGNFWAAPLVRLFAPEIADTLEVYRFHHPPALKGSGIVDVTPQQRTDLSIRFSTDRSADYKFLGKNLTLARPSGEVLIHGSRVAVKNLKTSAFGGPILADFLYSNGRLEGEASWTQLGLPEVASAYDFPLNGGGTTTGRIEFSCTNGRIETLNGNGLIGLEKAELFSVPMFGPLSTLVAAALNDRRAGHERAKDAFLTFGIHKGILSSNDFRTTTSSLVFTGDGNIDLATRDIDLTVRMNARGFLGLITLPLRPLYGLFQFHGTGPMKDTHWKSELFTTPPEEQNRTLLSPPKARPVQEFNPPKAVVIPESRRRR